LLVKRLCLFTLFVLLSLSALNCTKANNHPTQPPTGSTPTVGMTTDKTTETTPLTTTPISSASQTAKPGDTVKVDYTGKLEDGTVFDSSIGKTPLEFTIGGGQVISGFENAVLGMKVGESKTVNLPPEEAYGAHRDDLVVTVDKSQLNPGVNFAIGQQLTGKYADGTPATVVIVAVTETTVTVDGNHPLAGKTLTFDIKLLSIISED